MEDKEYDLLAKFNTTHWWILARRKIVHHVISTLHLPKNSKILEVGCGMGGNLSMLSEYGQLYATDMSEKAVAYSKSLNITNNIETGFLPEEPAFKGKIFNLIVAMDVIEHIDDDIGSLQQLYTQLDEGGKILITVPAFAFLWSSHDEHAHHKRRYTKPTLFNAIDDAGFKIDYVSYYNFWLFPLVLCVRMLSKLFKKQYDSPQSNLKETNPIVNYILEKIFASERFFIPKASFPFGVSLIAVISKK